MVLNHIKNKQINLIDEQLSEKTILVEHVALFGLDSLAQSQGFDNNLESNRDRLPRSTLAQTQKADMIHDRIMKQFVSTKTQRPEFRKEGVISNMTA